MAQAREHFAGTGPDSVGRSWLGIRRLPGGFYGEHAERLGRYGDGWHRGSRPVPLRLDGDDGSHDGASHAALDPALSPPRPQASEASARADWHGPSARELRWRLGYGGATGVRLQRA